jgi:hypothetical protein
MPGVSALWALPQKAASLRQPTAIGLPFSNPPAAKIEAPPPSRCYQKIFSVMPGWHGT